MAWWRNGRRKRLKPVTTVGSNPTQATCMGLWCSWMRHSGLKNRYVRYIAGSKPAFPTLRQEQQSSRYSRHFFCELINCLDIFALWRCVATGETKQSLKLIGESPLRVQIPPPLLSDANSNLISRTIFLLLVRSQSGNTVPRSSNGRTKDNEIASGFLFTWDVCIIRRDILEKRNDICRWIEEKRSKAYMCRELDCKPETLNSYLVKMGMTYKGQQALKGVSKNFDSYKPALYYTENNIPFSSHKLKAKLVKDG